MIVVGIWLFVWQAKGMKGGQRKQSWKLRERAFCHAMVLLSTVLRAMRKDSKIKKKERKQCVEQKCTSKSTAEQYKC